MKQGLIKSNNCMTCKTEFVLPLGTDEIAQSLLLWHQPDSFEQMYTDLVLQKFCLQRILTAAKSSVHKEQGEGPDPRS